MKVRLTLLGIAGAIALACGLAAAPQQASAQCTTSVFARHPCTPGFGSVLNHHPYTPGFCGIHSAPGCIPYGNYPLNQVPVLHVHGHFGPLEPLDRNEKANRIDEMGPLLSKCLEMPPDDEVRTGMRVTIKLAFKRNGELLGKPRFTYTTHEAPDEIKAAYREAAMNMVDRCMPLPITDSLGRAIAGRPFVVPIIETRVADNTKSADAPKSPPAATPATTGMPATPAAPDDPHP
jgi:hypothetical protein